jgi:RNA-binding protein YhbY
MNKGITKIQVGKNGVSENFLKTLKEHLKNRRYLRVSVLKNAREDGSEGKKQIKEISEKISEFLGNKFSIKKIGFTIKIKKK